MPRDILNKDNATFTAWLDYYGQKIREIGTRVKLTEDDILHAEQVCAKMIEVQRQLDDAQRQVKALASRKREVHQSGKAFLRKQIRRIKAAEDYEGMMGEELGIINQTSRFDPDTFRPVISLRRVSKGVEVKFTKGRSHGVNIYRRIEGEINWALLGRDTRSPFIDINLPDEHVVLNYMAWGVLDDVEIGRESKIASVSV